MTTIAKKILAFIMAAVTGWIISTLTGFGISIEDAQLVVNAVETILSVGITFLVFFIGDYLLSKLKGFFPGDWAEMIWRNQAGEQVKKMSTAEAKNEIASGRI